MRILRRRAVGVCPARDAPAGIGRLIGLRASRAGFRTSRAPLGSSVACVGRRRRRAGSAPGRTRPLWGRFPGRFDGRPLGTRRQWHDVSGLRRTCRPTRRGQPGSPSPTCARRPALAGGLLACGPGHAKKAAPCRPLRPRALARG
ncbi:hypothetical protein FHS42_001951 [Streptomyces zagrosensis]|uniref:Uncharacterized protein n=1 Tax=Streptomyces zagrosensis TaxID=1042984 RepID=A0A7W9Q775_9ACTN|nr:hypothetical protein [Streptomyces zagrosensis]